MLLFNTLEIFAGVRFNFPERGDQSYIERPLGQNEGCLTRTPGSAFRYYVLLESDEDQLGLGL
jgi:hypothetical protein